MEVASCRLLHSPLSFQNKVILGKYYGIDRIRTSQADEISVTSLHSSTTVTRHGDVGAAEIVPTIDISMRERRNGRIDILVQVFFF